MEWFQEAFNLPQSDGVFLIRSAIVCRENIEKGLFTLDAIQGFIDVYDISESYIRLPELANNGDYARLQRLVVFWLGESARLETEAAFLGAEGAEVEFHLTKLILRDMYARLLNLTSAPNFPPAITVPMITRRPTHRN